MVDRKFFIFPTLLEHLLTIWKSTVFSEFNSGAWLYDLGVYVPANCSAAAKRSLDAKMPAYFLNRKN